MYIWLMLTFGTFSFGFDQKDWATLLQSEHLNSAQLALITEFKIELSKSEMLLENVTEIPYIEHSETGPLHL